MRPIAIVVGATCLLAASTAQAQIGLNVYGDFDYILTVKEVFGGRNDVQPATTLYSKRIRNSAFPLKVGSPCEITVTLIDRLYSNS